jgi:hypothetical protein
LTGATGRNQKGVAGPEDYSFRWLTVDGKAQRRAI